MTVSLIELVETHQGKLVDKWKSYLLAYGDLFENLREQPVNILEIGIQNGGSLEIWSRFFPHARSIVGCDINENCRNLKFEDERISVIVGDANDADTVERISKVCGDFNIVIDDGSHLSSDIIKSFSLYFPMLSDEGGVFIAEDLHASYWMEFEGGTEAPYSSINFFKRLVDIVNFEHWGSSLEAREILAYYSKRWDVEFCEKDLRKISEVRFRNSIATIVKASESKCGLGVRTVFGLNASIDSAPMLLKGRTTIVPDQSSNRFGPNSRRAEFDVEGRDAVNDLVVQIDERRRNAESEIVALRVELAKIEVQNKDLDSKVVSANAENRALEGRLSVAYVTLEEAYDKLIDARRRPLTVLSDYTIYVLCTLGSRTVGKMFPATEEWFSSVARSISPDRRS